MTTTWDPAQYLRHADHRSRPFHDLVARIPITPRHVVDLGCGPGNVTATLTGTWPHARIIGIDSSPEMIRAARLDHPELRFEIGDIADYTPGDEDLLLSNAALQWIPGHADLFPAWIDALPVGGVLAFQVPANFGSPSHTLLAETAGLARWAGRFDAVDRASVPEPGEYLARLGALGCTVDAWETTYHQVLQGGNPVLDWMLGTGLRPVLAALTDPEDQEAFLSEYGAKLARAYPTTTQGTVLPFRRIFVVATKN